MKQIAVVLVIFVSALQMQAQSAEAGPVGGDGSNVVIAVLGLIFAGFFVFLIFTDRKITRLEKEIKNKKS